MKPFIEAQFNYKPLTWLFHEHKTNQIFNHLQERSLRLVYNDQISTFEELLQKDYAKICIVPITEIFKALQSSLTIELHKLKNNLLFKS